MTETYYGPWDPVTGDRPEKVQEDPYHPRYPDVGDYPNTKAEGLGEKPVSNADQTRWDWVIGKIAR